MSNYYERSLTYLKVLFIVMLCRKLIKAMR